MKSIMNTIAFMALTFSWTGLSQSTPVIKEMTPEARSNIWVKTGGMIRRPSTGASIAIINAQKKIPISAIGLKIEEMQSVLHLPFKIIEEPGADVVKVAEGVLKDTNIAVVVAVYDEPNKPSLLIAPDARWALVNVAGLDAGGVKHDIVYTRLGKQLGRGLCAVLGVGYSSQQDSILQPLKKIEDLDKIQNKVVSMESWSALFSQARRLGIQRSQVTTYKKACEEGWAPMPTNSFQKAIWEEVKASKK